MHMMISLHLICIYRQITFFGLLVDCGRNSGLLDMDVISTRTLFITVKKDTRM